jgi:hypothetical protein
MSLIIARIANIIALSGYFLPWFGVLPTGKIGLFLMHDLMSSESFKAIGLSSLWLPIGVAMTLLGVPASLLVAKRRRADVVLLFSAIALAANFIGVGVIHDYVAGKGVYIQYGVGYLLTMLSLAGSIGCCLVVKFQNSSLRERPISPLNTRPNAHGSDPVSGSTFPDPDIVFWDGMADKNEPDLLHEYLLRFPAGRFRDLARAKLDRQGRQIPEAAPLPTACPQCAAPTEGTARFCEKCGAALAPSPGH